MTLIKCRSQGVTNTPPSLTGGVEYSSSIFAFALRLTKVPVCDAKISFVCPQHLFPIFLCPISVFIAHLNLFLLLASLTYDFLSLILC